MSVKDLDIDLRKGKETLVSIMMESNKIAQDRIRVELKTWQQMVVS